MQLWRGCTQVWNASKGWLLQQVPAGGSRDSAYSQSSSTSQHGSRPYRLACSCAPIHHFVSESLPAAAELVHAAEDQVA